jgi:hypothetical protein
MNFLYIFTIYFNYYFISIDEIMKYINKEIYEIIK